MRTTLALVALAGCGEAALSPRLTPAPPPVKAPACPPCPSCPAPNLTDGSAPTTITLPPDRRVIHVVSGFVHYDACPSQKDLQLGVEDVAGVDEPAVVDTSAPAMCAALQAADDLPTRRWFVAAIDVHARVEPPGCEIGETFTSCHGSRVGYYGTIALAVPEPDRVAAFAAKATIVNQGFPADALHGGR